MNPQVPCADSCTPNTQGCPASTTWYNAQPEKTLRFWHDQIGADATPAQVYQAAAQLGRHVYGLPALDLSAAGIPAPLSGAQVGADVPVRPFIHTPRPVLQSASDRHTARRSFGSVGSTQQRPAVGISARTGNPTEFIFYRSALLDAATLELAVCGQVRSVLNVRMRAADLRALAALAIDAAHDLETYSADALALTRQGTPA